MGKSKTCYHSAVNTFHSFFVFDYKDENGRHYLHQAFESCSELKKWNMQMDLYHNVLP